MYVCIYIYIICIYAYVYLDIYVYIYICVCIPRYLYIYIFIITINEYIDKQINKYISIILQYYIYIYIHPDIDRICMLQRSSLWPEDSFCLNCAFSICRMNIVGQRTGSPSCTRFTYGPIWGLSWFITSLTMVYDSYNANIHGISKPTKR